ATRARKQPSASFDLSWLALPSQRDPIPAGIGAAHERALAYGNAVGLPGLVEQLRRCFHLVALPGQAAEHAPADTALDVKRVRGLAGQELADQEARPLDRFLHVQAEVEHVAEDLRVEHRLAVGAHRRV